MESGKVEGLSSELFQSSSVSSTESKLQSEEEIKRAQFRAGGLPQISNKDDYKRQRGNIAEELRKKDRAKKTKMKRMYETDFPGNEDEQSLMDPMAHGEAPQIIPENIISP